MILVSRVNGIVRYDNVFKSLEKLEIGEKISNAKNIIICPNLLHYNGCESQANSDATRAILDYADEFTNKRITIAASSFTDEDFYHKHGFSQLHKDYPIKFIDLAHDDAVAIEVEKRKFGVSQAMIKSDLRISLSGIDLQRRAKTILTIPNTVYSSIATEDKIDFIKNSNIHKKIFELSSLLHPHISVFDGFGDKTESFALSSANAPSADKVAATRAKIRQPQYLKYFPIQKYKVI